MTLLSTQTIAGDGTAKEIEYPTIASSNAKIVLVFDDFAEDLTLYQTDASGASVRVPASEPQPFPVGPFRAGNLPALVEVADTDSATITLHRVPA